jgi:hypothetical protein
MTSDIVGYKIVQYYFPCYKCPLNYDPKARVSAIEPILVARRQFIPRLPYESNEQQEDISQFLVTRRITPN